MESPKNMEEANELLNNLERGQEDLFRMLSAQMGNHEIERTLLEWNPQEQRYGEVVVHIPGCLSCRMGSPGLPDVRWVERLSDTSL